MLSIAVLEFKALDRILHLRCFQPAAVKAIFPVNKEEPCSMMDEQLSDENMTPTTVTFAIYFSGTQVHCQRLKDH